MARDPYGLQLTTLSEFFAQQAEGRTEMIKLFTYLTTGILSLGAIVASLHTMFASVSSRTVEIGVLMAMGFSSISVFCPVVLEAIFLSAIGGGIGSAIAILTVNGIHTSLLNRSAFMEIAFQLAVTRELVITTILFTVILGLFGAIIPSIRAVRMPIVDALRDA